MSISGALWRVQCTNQQLLARGGLRLIFWVFFRVCQPSQWWGDGSQTDRFCRIPGDRGQTGTDRLSEVLMICKWIYYYFVIHRCLLFLIIVFILRLQFAVCPLFHVFQMYMICQWLARLNTNAKNQVNSVTWCSHLFSTTWILLHPINSLLKLARPTSNEFKQFFAELANLCYFNLPEKK